MKTNYFLKSAVMTALCFASFQLSAQTVVNGVAYKVVDGVAETSYLPGDVKYTAATIVVEANVTIDGKSYPVKKIGDNSMRENPNLVSVTIPEGVEIIGNSSFAQCEKLPTVVLPSTVNKIDVWAFFGCKSLASINIPDGVSIITEHTFQQTALTNVILPASVKTLDVCAFQTTPLESINLDNVEIIKGWSLAQTKLKSASSEKTTNVAEVSFTECTELVEVNFPNVVAIGGGSAFKGCTKLVSVNLDKSSNTGNEAFNGCTALTSVKMGSLVNIGDWAFANCSSLKSLIIPKTVTIISSWALEKTGLEEVFISWSQSDLDELFLGENFYGAEEGQSDFTWKVPADLKDLYGDEWEGLPVEVGTPSGIEQSVADKVEVYYSNGSLNLINLDGANVSIITLDGRVVKSFQVNGTENEVPVQLNSGVYVLRANNNVSVKFIVK